MGATQRQILSDRAPDVFVAYLIRRYREVSRVALGRTILQKLCYFAEANGVPLRFRFEIYHYGPFSQEIFDVTEDLQMSGVIVDRSQDPGRSDYAPGPDSDGFLNAFGDLIRRYKSKLDNVVDTFAELDPSQMELVSTIHYMHTSHREWFKEIPSKKNVVASVVHVKGDKFDIQTVGRVYDILRDAGLLP